MINNHALLRIVLFSLLLFVVSGLHADEARLSLGCLDLSKMSYGALGQATKDKNLEDSPIRISDQEYREGVCTHAFSDMRISINDAERFVAEVGIDGKFPHSGSVQFKIYCDDKLIWKSGIKRGGEQAEKVDISLKGYSIIDLAVTDGGDGYECDWADWGDAAFFVTGKPPVALTLPHISERKSRISGPDEEKEWIESWFRENILESSVPVCSFHYGGVPMKQIICQWKRETSLRKLDDNKTEYVILYTDEKTGLELRCIAVAYSDFPAVEWTFWLKNTGSKPTPLISELQAINATMFKNFNQRGQFVLHHFKGDDCSPDGYEPYQYVFKNENAITFAPSGGRPTDTEFPYYRIQGPNGGLFFVVSWQGQWETTFHSENGIRIRAGQQQVHCSLLPGEEIRTPMIFCMFYSGNDTVRGVNLWRRWFIEHNMPRVDGERIPPVYANFSGEIFSNVNENDTQEDLMRFTDRFFDNHVPFDYYWLDAGWYPCKVPGEERNEWPYVGTWEFDPLRFPQGLRPVSDHIHAKGAKVLVWFEPERVTPGSELAIKHPEWILGGTLLNLGNPDARNWISQRICNLLHDEEIDWYRQDFNIPPLDYWRKADAENRQGITENLYCQGYLKFWDDLLDNRPGLIIDSCASGGRRNDLETLRRSLPVHVTDYNYGDLTVKQAMHHSLFQWFPYFAGVNWPADQSDIYYHRSNYSLMYLGNERQIFEQGYDFEKLRSWMDEWRETVALHYADYYPLFPYSRNHSDWIGWQFHSPETDEGMVQLFKRPQASFISGAFQLKSLDSDKTYHVKNYNTMKVDLRTGKELMEKGLFVELWNAPDSIVLRYWK